MKNLTLITLLLLFHSCLSPNEAQNKSQVVKAMGETVAKQFSDINHISIEEVQKLKKDNYIVVDIRSAPEIKVSYIPGSITQNEFEENLTLYKDKKVITYSTLGPRSSKYTRILNDKGIKAYNLQEGILGWVHRSLPLLEAGKETHRVHVYTDAYDFTPKGYEGVYK